MRLIPVCLLLGIVTLPAVAQDQPAAPVEEPIVEFSFDADIGGWTALDDTAVLTLTHEADEVKAGTGALSWEFTPAAGKMPGLVAETAPAPEGRSLSLWVKSTVGCVLAVALQEAGGARYITGSYCPANEWTHIQTNLADLTLSDDTTDDNDRLDPDQIASCLILDLASLIIQNPEASQFLAVSADPRTIIIDEFRISPNTVAPQRIVKQAPGGGREITLQTFDTGSMFLIPVRNTTIQTVGFEGKAGGAVSMNYDMTAAEFPIAGAIMPMQQGELSGLARLRLVVSSEQPITLAVMVEEKESPADGRDKSNYTATHTLAGGGQWETIELSRDDFILNDDSSDENGQLDAGQLSMISVLDASGFMLGTPTPANALILDEITAITTE